MASNDLDLNKEYSTTYVMHAAAWPTMYRYAVQCHGQSCIFPITDSNSEQTLVLFMCSLL